jgi:DNA-binding LytR/AlgR family response regulator
MKILIIEDESQIAQHLQQSLLHLQPDLQFLETLDSVESSLHWLNNNPMPDVIFSDIQLADGNSFEIFKQIPMTCPIIFLTAYNEYAIEALRLGAIDYLLKPIKKEELKNAFEKAIEKVFAEQKNRTVKFISKIGSTIKIFDYQEVIYFFSQEKITFAMLENSKRYPIDYPLDKLENMLSKEQFFRANRQVLLQKKAIQGIQTHTKSRLLLSLTPTHYENIIISTEKANDLKQWLLK